LRFRDRRARLQPRDHARDAAARVARFRPTLFHTGFYRKKNACLGREKTKSRRQDANDLSLDTIYAGITTQNVWIGIEILPPEGVGQDNDVRLQVRSSSVKLRPIARLTPSVVKKSGEIRTISSCCMEPGSPTVFGSLHIHRKALEGRDVAAAFVVIGNR